MLVNKEKYYSYIELKNLIKNQNIITKESYISNYKKLEIYGEKFTKKAFRECLKKVEKVWDKELKPLMLRVPEFRAVKKEITLKLGN